VANDDESDDKAGEGKPLNTPEGKHRPVAPLPDEADGADIAIIGMAGRFPGARTIDEFWRNLCAGVESITHFTADELLSAGAPAALVHDPQFVKAVSKIDDIELFDPTFFGYHPKEAEIMDPQHRVLLECAWEAMENAGYYSGAHEGIIGVYAGAAANTYLLFHLASNPAVETVDRMQLNLGNSEDFLATRISYKLNLNGPSLSVRTACSTSLVAVHLACQSLLNEECDIALAGGTCVNVSQPFGYRYLPGGIVSPDGHCRAFDARAQGTIFGSGVGVVALKRLADAIANGDTIHAVVKGSAINNDGAAKVGYTAPSVDGQAEVITEAQAVAGVKPETISYIEAHGTGTAIGDPIEIEALTKAFRAHTQERGFCAIGSVKTNIGHLDAAAGIAGLIKTVLALKHRQLPPTLHFTEPNPQIDFANSPFYVNARLSEWNAGSRPRRAGVSSFGIGGTNAHVVLEEAPQVFPASPARPWKLMLLSAKTATALETTTERLTSHLAEHPELESADIAYTLQLGRRSFAHRLALVCQDTADAKRVLQERDAQKLWTSIVPDSGERPVAFMFPGQGTQYVQMASNLYQHEPLFRAQIDRCSSLLSPQLGLDLRSILYPPLETSGATEEQLRQTALAQPALFVVEYALAQLFIALGISPQAMLGHSLGEYVAACLAGVFSLEEALELMVVRGRLMQEMEAGAMLAVSLSEQDVQPLLSEHIALAAINGPSRCVLAGPVHEVANLEKHLRGQAIACQQLHTSHAFHTPMMNPVAERIARHLRGMRLQPPQIPFISNLTGTWITPEDATNPDYWAQQLRQPVRMAQGLETLLDGTRVLLEVGPGRTLSQLLQQQRAKTPEQLVLTSLRHPSEQHEDLSMLCQTLGKLWLAGVEIDWASWYRGERRRRVALPSYPFERQRYWIAPPSSARNEASPDAAAKEHGASEATADEATTETLSSAEQTGLHASEVSMTEQRKDAPTLSNRQENIVATLKLILHELSGVDPATVDPQVSLYELGVDSLLLLQMNQAIKDRFDITIALRQFFEELSTLSALAAFIDQHLPPEEQPSPILAHSKEREAIAHAPAAEQTASPALPVEPPAPAPTPLAQQAAPLERVLPTAPGEVLPMTLPASATNGNGTDGVAGSAAERILAQQIQLMTQQLALLQNWSASGAQSPTLTQGLPMTPQAAATHQPPPPSTAAFHAQDNGEAQSEQRETFVPYQPLAIKAGSVMEQRQQQHLARLIERYTTRTPGSKQMIQNHRAVLANNRNVAGFRLQLKEMIYQVVAQKASGSKFWDIDGHEYLDISMGFGVYLFGHDAPFIRQAAEEELRRGTPVGPFSATAGTVAELIRELTGVERVAFFNSGTEAVMVALRLARAVTGRSKIAIFAGSFHGTFDGILARAFTASPATRSVPLAPGIPEHMTDHVLVLNYGSPDALATIAAHAHELAAVLVEPVQSRRPDFQPQDFLRQLRALTEQKDIALIFDEVITGFRIHPGGAQAHFGVRADLVTYGKIIGGGMPIGVVAGKATYMDSIDGGTWQFGDDSYPAYDEKRTFVAGTFCQHPLAMSTAVAVLRTLREQGAELQRRLNQRTAQLVETLNAYFKEAAVPIQMVHFGSLFRFVLRGDLELLYYHLLEKGIYVWEGRNCFLSTAHTDEDIDRLVRAVKESVEELRSGGFLPEAPAPRPDNGASQPKTTTQPVTASGPTSTVAINQAGASSAAPAAAASFVVRRPLGHSDGNGHAPRAAIAFSLSYFGRYEAAFDADKYSLLFEGARMADRAGFAAVWIPERHFHPFGGLSPNPSVLAAALARETERIHIRAGSVVLPLHHPIRVAEEWSLVDNLSRGRIGVSFASGWHADDFVFAPQVYGEHRELMFSQIETVQRLWQGETMQFTGGSGSPVSVKLFPMPFQRTLPTWVTVVKNPDSYRRAGAIGAGVLTNLMDQSVDELEANLKVYREALAAHGFPPETGRVTVLLHTYLDESVEEARRKARQPFYTYLKSFLGLTRNLAKSLGVQVNLDRVSDEDIEHVLAMAYDRYVQSSALIGTQESCVPIIDRLISLGVDEIACFVDFGVDSPSALQSLERVKALKEHFAQRVSAQADGADDQPPVEEPIEVPLTEEQKQLWVLTQLSDEASSAYNESIILKLRGPLRVEAMRQALRSLVERHEALRMTISPDGASQHVWPTRPLEVQLIDFTDANPDRPRMSIEQWMTEEGRRPFDLAKGPLMRTSLLKQGEQEYLLIFIVHHIIVDDWSRGVLLYELGSLYSAACAGSTAELREASPFRAFVEWQATQQQRESADALAAKAYWQSRFAASPPALELPTDYLRPALRSYVGARHQLALDPTLYTGLKRLSGQHSTTIFALLLAAFTAFLHRLTAQNDIVLGIPTAGQPMFGATNLVGQCITMLPFHTPVDGQRTLAEHLASIRNLLLDVQEHPYYPVALSEGQGNANHSAGQIPPLNVMFNMDRAITVPAFGDLRAEILPFPISYVKFDLSLNCIEIDKALQLHYEYRTDLFEDATVGQWVQYFEAFLREIVAGPESTIAALPLHDPAKAKQMLALPKVDASDQSSLPAESFTPLHRLFEQQVKQTPSALAVVTADASLTYEELHQASNQFAQYLRARGMKEGQVIAVGLEESSIELVTCLLGILKAGCACAVIATDLAEEQQAEILERSAAALLVTRQSATTPLLANRFPVLFLDLEQDEIARARTEPLEHETSGAAIACVLTAPHADGAHTLLSISHDAAVKQCRVIAETLALKAGDRFLSINEQAGAAMWSVFAPLLGAGTLVLTNSRDWSMATLQQQISELDISVVEISLNRWRLLAGQPDAGQALRLPAQLRFLVRGSRPINSGQQRRWQKGALGAARLWFGYQPEALPLIAAVAEVTSESAAADAPRRSSIGQPVAGARLCVLDARMQPAPLGVVGELCLDAESLTGEKLAVKGLEGGSSQLEAATDSKLSGTGVRARYRADGAIEWVGLASDLIWVRGRRVELREVAAAMVEHPMVHDAVVLYSEVEDSPERQVVAYFATVNDNAPDDSQTGTLTSQSSIQTVQSLRRFLREQLPEYMQPNLFVTMGQLPLKPNGTIDRERLPKPQFNRSILESSDSPRNEVEEQLATIWSEVLGVGSIGINDNFFELGGHSLLATMLAAKVCAAFPVNLTLRNLFDAPTVAEMAALISRMLGQNGDAQLQPADPLPQIEPQPEKWSEPFALTDVQQAYWIGRSGLFGLGNVSTHAYYEIETTDLDLERFVFAWQRLIERHGMLRAIVLQQGEQQILQQVEPYQIEVQDLRGGNDKTVAARLEEVRQRMSHQVMPSDRWPLFEIYGSRLDDRRLRLHISVDALIVDAWSMQILFWELEHFYRNPTAQLAPLTLSFRDYVVGEGRIVETDFYRRSHEYWQRRLPTLPPAPELPLAHDPASLQQPQFVRWTGRLERETWARLKSRASRASITPSIALLAAYAEVLTLWSKSPQFTVNLTLFNRLPLHAEVNEIVGDFTSVTLLTVDNSIADTFEQRAKRIQEQLWEDLDHRYVSGVRVLRDLARMRQVTNGLLMPVVFTSSLIHDEGDLETSPMAWLGQVVYSITQTPQVWLDHEVYEDAGALVFTWDVVAELFPDGLVQAMFDGFSSLLQRLADDEQLWTTAWPEVARQLIPAAQLEQQVEANSTAAPVPTTLLHTAFHAQAAQRPDQPAVLTSSHSLTYEELSRRANQVGRRLRELGALPNTLVAVVMEKGWEQIVAVLGILNAGAAYLPIDPALPRDRILYLLEHGRATLALTQNWFNEHFSWPSNVHHFCLDAEELAEVDDSPLEMVQRPDDLAYVIYTSGSTGTPKGVMIDHRGALNTVLDVNQRYGVQAGDRVFALSSLSFDLSVYDIFGLLAAGGTIIIPDAWATRDPAHWAELINREQVTIWNSVPTLMEMLIEYADGADGILPASLRLVMMSGDWIPVNLPERIRALRPQVQLVSMGGATEASIWSILYDIEEVDSAWKSIPYGKPMLNQTFHVLDDSLEERPTWVPGELYIGGVGLAKGYWRDEAKTEARFLTHPRTSQRLYRTGDLGRYLPDGNIEFLGREDFQVKVQGHRIELGEIEAALVQHPKVRAAVVAAVGKERSNKRLVAYVVPDAEGPHTNGNERRAAGHTLQLSESSDTLLIDPLARLKFKLSQPGLRNEDNRQTIFLMKPESSEREIEADFIARRSYRTFQQQLMTFEQMSLLLACLRQLEFDGSPFPKYRYGSAGSIYPVQLYVYVKANRIEGIDGGVYYYHPREHCLMLLAADASIDSAAYDQSNRAVFDAAGFALFLIGRVDAIEKMYPQEGRQFASLEAGLMTQLLEMNAPTHLVGLCQVGNLDFASIRHLFALTEKHVLLHSLLGGAIVQEQRAMSGFIEDAREYRELFEMLGTEATPKEVDSAIASASSPEEFFTGSDQQDDVAELRSWLQQKLPEYMVPTAFVMLEALPLSANGKVDRKALPEPEEMPDPRIESYVAPETDLEHDIAGLLQDILQTERIGVHDNFFDLGGNSLHLIRFHNKLQRLLNREIPITDMFRHVTINSLAQYLGHSRPQQSNERSEALSAGKDRMERLLKRRPV
jgi:natural product biosynthesis luciferase-like monooxygenase protein/amino acid adenylation domain-containing protein